MPKQPLEELAVACGAHSMVSPFTHPKGPRLSVKFKLEDGSLERFAAAILAETLPGAAISVDVSAGEVDAGDRIFACVDEVMGQGADAVIIATETSRNFQVSAPDKALRDAVGKLIKAKGRFHTEQNYLALVAAYDAIKEKA